MDVRSYIKYPYIFYNILVFFLNFGVYHTNNRETGDNKNSVKKPVIFRGG